MAVIARALSPGTVLGALAMTLLSSRSLHFMRIKGGSKMNHWGRPDSSIPLGGCLLPRTSSDVGQLLCLCPPLATVVGLAFLAFIRPHKPSVQGT